MDPLVASARSADGCGGLESLFCWASFPTTMMIPRDAQSETRRFFGLSEGLSEIGKSETSRSIQQTLRASEPITLVSSNFQPPWPPTTDGKEKHWEAFGYAGAGPVWIRSNSMNSTDFDELPQNPVPACALPSPAPPEVTP